MGEAKRRAQAAGLRVLDGGKTEQRPKSVPQVQLTVLVPKDMAQAIDERYPLVQFKVPSRNDFVISLLDYALLAFDAKIEARKAEMEKHAAGTNVTVDPDGPAVAEEEPDAGGEG